MWSSSINLLSFVFIIIKILRHGLNLVPLALIQKTSKLEGRMNVSHEIYCNYNHTLLQRMSGTTVHNYHQMLFLNRCRCAAADIHYQKRF
jgi:hypothetical protein